MNQLTTAWFEYKNVRSDSLGILLTEMPKR